jgi:hypothetical protein
VPFDLSKTLVVGISATALFDLSAEDEIFIQRYISFFCLLWIE